MQSTLNIKLKNKQIVDLSKKTKSVIATFSGCYDRLVIFKIRN